MGHSYTGWLTIVTASILSACGGAHDAASNSASPSSGADTSAIQRTAPTQTNRADAIVQTDDITPRGQTQEPFSEVSVAPKAQVTDNAHIDLGAPSATELEQRTRNNRRTPGVIEGGKAYQTGVNRPVAAAGDIRKVHQLLSWERSAQGTLQTSVKLSSTGARSLRLGLLIENLPDSALLRVRSADASQAKQTTGQYINAAIRANVAADGDSPAARTYWMPPTLGEASVLEVELPAGTDPGTVRFSLPSLVHGVETALDAAEKLAEAKSACPGVTPDATCTPVAANNAVTYYDFVDSGITYVCTGTLVANRGATQQGYLLTANHCVGSQTVASTMETYWFWRSNTCNSGTTYTGYQYRSGGATLLFSRSELSASTRSPTGTDTAFLDLPYTPPSGTVYAGWAFERQAINNGLTYTGLHQPGGGLLRRSQGVIYTNAISLSDLQVSTAANASYPMYGVDWSSGITEGGSSGSALFKDVDTANPKIVGQLWGGSSSCTYTQGVDYYGRFDLAYENGLINWLNPGYAMVFRFYNSANGTHFFSANVAERDSVRQTMTHMVYEDPVFMVSPATASGLSPVHRFYNRSSGVHFYTINESERALVATIPSFNYEGIAWYARTVDNPAADSIPVYRFLRKATGTHLYTANTAERDAIINTMSASYTYEGTAYLAWAAN